MQPSKMSIPGKLVALLSIQGSRFVFFFDHIAPSSILQVLALSSLIQSCCGIKPVTRRRAPRRHNQSQGRVPQVTHFTYVHSSLVRAVTQPPQESGGTRKYTLPMFSGNREHRFGKKTIDTLEEIFSEQHSEDLTQQVNTYQHDMVHFAYPISKNVNNLKLNSFLLVPTFICALHSFPMFI